MKSIKKSLIAGITALALTTTIGAATITALEPALFPGSNIGLTGFSVQGIISGSTLTKATATTLDKKVVRIVATYSNGNSYQSTGFIIGDHTIATCAHGLYKSDSYPTSVTLYYGYNNGTQLAKETVTYSSTKKNILVHSSYISNTSSQSYDLGLITTTNDLSTYGKYDLNTSYGGSSTHTFTVKGYPLEEADGVTYENYQYYSTGAYYSKTSSLLNYSASTLGGMSGGPVIQNNKVVAVHIQDRSTTSYNTGTMNISWFSDKIT